MFLIKRVSIAAITLWCITLLFGLRPPRSLSVWGTFLGMGLLNNIIPFTLIVWGQTQIAIIGAALSYAFAGVFGRRFKTMGISPIVTAAGQVTASTLVLTPIAIMVDGPLDINTISTTAIFSIMSLAVLSTAVAYVLYFKYWNWQAQLTYCWSPCWYLFRRYY